MGKLNEKIEALADQLGDRFYLDVAKCHLYLKDAKLHLPLAEKLYVLIEENRVTLPALTEVLQEFRVPVGAGRNQLPLLQLFPTNTEKDLLDLLIELQDDR